MDEIVTCSICAQKYNSPHLIPKVLECGHTFCSPCLTKLFQEKPSCPNCRAEIKGAESSLPINYIALKAADIFKSKKFSKEEIVTSIDAMKKECMRRKDTILEKMTSSLKILDKCLDKLEALMNVVCESQTLDTVNAEKVLNELGKELMKTVVVMRSDDVKYSVSFLLSDFEDSEKYLTEIYKRVENEEKVFAVHKIGDDVKYGKISVYENKIFFHSLSLSEIPKESSLIWFDKLKQCVNHENFFTFIKVSCNEKSITKMVIIKMFDKQQSHHFIKTCTGEYGPCYKGTFLKKVSDYGNFKSIFCAENFFENDQQSNRVIDYDFGVETTGHYKCNVDQMFLYIRNIRIFEIILAKTTVNAGPGIIGRIISPMDLSDAISYDHPSFLKIVDCGIILEI